MDALVAGVWGLPGMNTLEREKERKEGGREGGREGERERERGRNERREADRERQRETEREKGCVCVVVGGERERKERVRGTR